MSDLSSDESVSSVETNPIEKPKKTRKPMSDEAKKAFAERMKASREAKKAVPKVPKEKKVSKAKAVSDEVFEDVDDEDPPPKRTSILTAKQKRDMAQGARERKEAKANKPSIVNNYYYNKKDKVEDKVEEVKVKKPRKPRVKKVLSVETVKPVVVQPKVPTMTFA